MTTKARTINAPSDKIGQHAPPRPALLDSGLRRNDAEERASGLPSRQPLCHARKNPNRSPSVIPEKCLTAALRHSGEGRNPVVLISHSRGAGMTTKGRTANAPSDKIGQHSPPRPALLDSGLRRAAKGIILPSRPACCRQGIQDFLSINDAGGGTDFLAGPFIKKPFSARLA